MFSIKYKDLCIKGIRFILRKQIEAIKPTNKIKYRETFSIYFPLNDFTSLYFKLISLFNEL